MPDTRKHRGPGPQDPTWFGVEARGVFGSTIRSALIDSGCSEDFVIDAQPEKPASTPDELTVLGQHVLSPSEEASLRCQILQTRAQLEDWDRLDAMRARREQQSRDAVPLIPPSEGEEKT